MGRRIVRWQRILAFVLALPLLIAAGFASAGGDWAGTWRMELRGTGGVVIFDQQGDRVHGRYPLYDGVIDAAIVPDSRGERIEGLWSVGKLGGKFVAVLSRDKQTFAGRFEDGEWCTGTRTSEPPLGPKFDLQTPREAIVAFVVAGNLAESGVDDAWALAASAMTLGTPDDTTSRSEQLRHTRELYDLISMTTFRYWAIPDAPAEADAFVVELRQQPSHVALPLKLRKDAAGKWRIVAPASETMHAWRHALLAAYGGKAPPADAYRRLQNPRDTMRAFLRGMTEWDRGGRELAMSTLDLTGMPEILRDTNGGLAAHYLRRVLDHIGLVGLQGIPDDGSSRAPYVHFVEGSHAIVIAPTGPGLDAPWKFTTQTISDIRDLYLVTERLPPPVVTPPGLIPASTFFELRGFVADHAPALLGGFGQSEYWQILLGLLFVVVALTFGHAVAGLLCRILVRLPDAKPVSAYFRWSIVILVVIALGYHLPGIIGLGVTFREYTIPVWGVIGCIAACIVSWHLVASLGAQLGAAVERTTSAIDDIMVTLLLGAVRVTIVVAGAMGMAHFLSIPMANLLAGLGIGGLAIAFASRETLANVFGAGILVSDRPFHRGDWIRTADIEGAVESVGVRSTRVRTAQDSVVFIPNCKLVDSTINNLGTRRFRLVKLQLPVTWGGTSERLQNFVGALRERILGDKTFDPAQTIIGISGISQSEISVDITTYLDVTTDAAESAARSALLLDIFQLADREGLCLGNGMVKPTIAGDVR